MAFEKQKNLIELLSKKTNEGKLDWRPGALENSYQVSFRSNSVMLAEADGLRATDYVVYLADANGEVVDKFSDNELRAENSGNDWTGNWFEVMRDLFQSARRVALGSDKILNSILDELKD